MKLKQVRYEYSTDLVNESGNVVGMVSKEFGLWKAYVNGYGNAGHYNSKKAAVETVTELYEEWTK